MTAVERITWTRPPANLAPLIRAAEDAHGIPRDLLAKLLHTESRWRPDVIDGRTKSRTGAVGIAQVLNSTARDPGYGVPPLKTTPNGLAPDERTDPAKAIPWAAKYLRAMFDRLGSWRQAAAAYNQGLGAVLKARRASPTNWPALLTEEGRNYVASVPDVIGVA